METPFAANMPCNFGASIGIATIWIGNANEFSTRAATTAPSVELISELTSAHSSQPLISMPCWTAYQQQSTLETPHNLLLTRRAAPYLLFYHTNATIRTRWGAGPSGDRAAHLSTGPSNFSITADACFSHGKSCQRNSDSASYRLKLRCAVPTNAAWATWANRCTCSFGMSPISAET